jgi:hypothetical protein
MFKKIIPGITAFISSRSFSLGCILIAVAARISHVLFVAHIGGDKMMLAAMSRNFLRGKGMAIPEYYVSNIEAATYNFAPLWPIGYTLSLAGFLKLFNYNLLWSFTAFDIIAALFFVLIIRKLCKLLEFNKPAVNVATLTAGCFDYTFINGSMPTDYITVTLMLAGFYFVLKSLKSEKISYLQLWTASFFLILPCFFRYSYHLAVASVPPLILFVSYLSKDNIAFKKGKIIFLAAAVFYIVLASVQYSLNGSLLYILKTEKGIYPENLLHWAPFIPLSFVSPNFYYVKLFSPFITFADYYSLLEIISALCFLVLSVLFYYYLKSLRFRLLLPVRQWFLFIGAAVAVGVLLLLVYATLTNKDQSFHGIPWNYITEPRYFAFVIVFIQLVFIGWAFSNSGIPVKNYFLKAIRFVLAAFLIIEITHGIYFNAMLPVRYTELKKSRYWENRSDFIVNTVSDFIKANKNKEILVGDYYPGANSLATFYGKKGLMNCLELNKQLPRVKQKTFLLMHLTDNKLSEFKVFFEKNPVQLFKKYENENFYLLELFP